MTDLEGLARKLRADKAPEDVLLGRMVQEILDFKNITREGALFLAKAVLNEVDASEAALRGKGDGVLEPIVSGVTMGAQGVGCRGTGDFFVHRLVAELCGPSDGTILTPGDMDDAGAIPIGEGCLVVKMEGMHSRLSDFPFLAGFHVTRAALRDLYVKGATPKGLLVDIHLADDADVGKLFDFVSGVACVSELADCPILGGSTLRIGGDMVIGTRMTGGVGAFGIAQRVLPRRDVRAGDLIVMTEGAGGGTICTTALYSGKMTAVNETLNMKFATASRALLGSKALASVDCMVDVTNGGIRADLHEIGQEAGCGAEVVEEKIISLVNPEVRKLLEETGVDPLGVSLDALLVFCRESAGEQIVSLLSKVGVQSKVIGRTTGDRALRIVRENGVREMLPRFRESAYTEVKKVVDSAKGQGTDLMEEELRAAAVKAEAKKKDAVLAVKEGRGLPAEV
jgi:hydrogenase expression/formation protein